MMSPGLLKRQAGVDFVRWCHRGAVRWLIWSSSFFFVRTPSCFVQTMDQKAVGYRMLYGPARINGRDA